MRRYIAVTLVLVLLTLQTGTAIAAEGNSTDSDGDSGGGDFVDKFMENLGEFFNDPVGMLQQALDVVLDFVGTFTDKMNEATSETQGSGDGS